MFDPTTFLQDLPSWLAQEPASNPLFDLFKSFGFIPFILLIMYFLVLRPEHRKQAAHKAMLQSLQKNDRVLTNGGMFGTVVAIRDDELVLKIDDSNNVRARFSRGAITRVFRDDDDDAKDKTSRGETGATGGTGDDNGHGKVLVGASRRKNGHKA